ncbi:MAG: WD40 repeat domain-containing protein, partial [Deltaproteobacteria bacterium]|nr:WD40 repeat domain-containing protein [Deltaproteobacteria bacterium]
MRKALVLAVPLLFLLLPAVSAKPPMDNTVAWKYGVPVTNDSASNISGLDISSDGAYIALVIENSPGLYLFSRDGSLLWKFSYSYELYIDTGAIPNFEFMSSSGDYIAVGADDGMCFLFSKDDNEPLWTYDTRQGGDLAGAEIDKAVVSDDGSYVAFEGPGAVVYFFSTADNTLKWSYDFEAGVSLSFSSTGSYLVVGDNEKIYLFSKNDNVPLWTSWLGDEVFSIAWDPDESHFCVGRYDDILYYFSRDDNTPVWTWQGSSVGPHDIDFSSDGSMIAVANGSDGMIYLFSSSDNEPIWSYDSGSGYARRVVLSDDGEYLLAGVYDPHKIIFFSTSSGDPIWEYCTGIDGAGSFMSKDASIVSACVLGSVYLTAWMYIPPPPPPPPPPVVYPTSKELSITAEVTDLFGCPYVCPGEDAKLSAHVTRTVQRGSTVETISVSDAIVSSVLPWGECVGLAPLGNGNYGVVVTVPEYVPVGTYDVYFSATYPGYSPAQTVVTLEVVSEEDKEDYLSENYYYLLESGKYSELGIREFYSFFMGIQGRPTDAPFPTPLPAPSITKPVERSIFPGAPPIDLRWLVLLLLLPMLAFLWPKRWRGPENWETSAPPGSWTSLTGVQLLVVATLLFGGWIMSSFGPTSQVTLTYVVMASVFLFSALMEFRSLASPVAVMGTGEPTFRQVVLGVVLGSVFVISAGLAGEA